MLEKRPEVPRRGSVLTAGDYLVLEEIKEFLNICWGCPAIETGYQLSNIIEIIKTLWI